MKLEDHPTVKKYREKGGEAAASEAADILDAEWLKQQVMEAGADDVGLADINCPDLSGYRADILELFPWAKTLEVKEGHVNTADLHVTADTRTWLDFLAKEKSLPVALVSRKLRIKGSPKLMMAFAKCFPS